MRAIFLKMKTNKKVTHILIVDDDTAIRKMLSKFFRTHGLVTTTASNGEEMLKVLSKNNIDIVLLDIMMPGDDGLTLCKRMQAQPLAPPVILLTAVDGEADKIVGLEIGADDYVVKPFSPRELLARIRTVLRRVEKKEAPTLERESPTYTFANWSIDLGQRTLHAPDMTLVMLTSTEFDLLSILINNPRTPLSRNQLSEMLHGRATSHYDRSMDVQISRLRRKIEDNPQSPEFIKTLRNEGYFFTPSVIKKE